MRHRLGARREKAHRQVQVLQAKYMKMNVAVAANMVAHGMRSQNTILYKCPNHFRSQVERMSFVIIFLFTAQFMFAVVYFVGMLMMCRNISRFVSLPFVASIIILL